MAAPTTLRFGAGAFYIGDGATPTEVFAKVCGFTEMELTIDKETNDTTVPDCDDPDAAAWTERDVVALAWSMTFSGVLAKEALPLLEDATFSSAPTNVRLDLAGAGEGSGTPNKRYAGRAHINHSITGARGEKWQVSVTVTGDGELVRSDVAAA
ncbi:MAG TPA: phage tail tube protein [Microvirga sp.]|nr:phage tail tube protein [Microvirga sp.]